MLLPIVLLMPIQSPPLTASTAPPVVVTRSIERSVVPPAFAPYASNRRVPVEVVVRSPDGILWQGMLVVGERGTSTYTQSKSEPEDPNCGRDSYRYGDREGLNVQLMLIPADAGSGAAERINATIRWTRAGEGACAGTRVVELRQSTAADAGQRIVLKGDAGLLVELRRR